METTTTNGLPEDAVAIEGMESEWRKAAEEMTFFGIPVKDLSRERLLLLVGMLSLESRRVQDEARRVLQMYRVR